MSGFHCSPQCNQETPPSSWDRVSLSPATSELEEAEVAGILSLRPPEPAASQSPAAHTDGQADIELRRLPHSCALSESLG